jgi:enoyl-CoA hydratase/carnithine racemase
VLLAIDGEVATVTLNRPERLNAQTPQMWADLARISRELPGTVRVVLLRGTGRAFSAGLDRALLAAGSADDHGGDGDDATGGIRELAGRPAAEANAQIARWQQGFDWQSRPSLISLAVVQGHAIGAGLQLALGADIRILAADAELAMPEATLGLVPDLGGTKRLVDLVGYSLAADMCLTGRRVGAAEALQIGLASAVVPVAELDAAAVATVAALLAVDRGAAAETKALLLATSGRSQAAQQGAEREAQYRRLRALAGLDAEY